MSDVDWDQWVWQVSSSGTITIRSPDGSTIAESIAIGRDGINASDNDRHHNGEWANLKIANRAAPKTTNAAFNPSTPKGRAFRENYSPSDDTFPIYAIVGWSRTAEGLVFAKAARKGLSGQISGSEVLRDQNSFRGNEFRVLKKGKITPAAIIPHISLTIPTNLIELKQALWTPGTSISNTPIGTGHWTRQGGLSDLIKQQANILYDGTPLNPITRCSVLPESTDVSAHAALSQPVLPLGGNWILNGEILLQGGLDTPGFHLRLHLVLLKEYDIELLNTLKDFARRQRFDHLNMPIMLQACEVYHDIMSSPDLQLEEVFKVKGNASDSHNVPECPLSSFVVYFQHWIRFAEFHSMSDYIHPFRFIAEMYSEDSECEVPRAVEVFNISNELDYDIVRRLLIGASSKVPSIDKDHKIRVLPFMMEGTKMPMVNFGERHPIQAPHRIALALTGMGNVYSLGTPSYACNISCEIKWTIPMHIANIISPHRQHAGVRREDRRLDFVRCPKITCLGPIWKVESTEATYGTDTNTNRNDILRDSRRNSQAPSVESHSNIVLHSSTSIVIDDSEASRAVVETVGDGQSIDEHNDASTCSHYPALDNSEYRTVTELLRRPRQHCAWNQVADELLASYPIDAEPPASRVLEALDKGLERVREDRTQVKSLADVATWGKNNPFVKWLPQTVCRFYGHDSKGNNERIHETLDEINEDISKLTFRVISSQYMTFAGAYNLTIETDKEEIMADVQDLLMHLLKSYTVETYIECLRVDI